jgi:hypothetical protein
VISNSNTVIGRVKREIYFVRGKAAGCLSMAILYEYRRQSG